MALEDELVDLAGRILRFGSATKSPTIADPSRDRVMMDSFHALFDADLEAARQGLEARGLTPARARELIPAPEGPEQIGACASAIENVAEALRGRLPEDR